MARQSVVVEEPFNVLAHLERISIAYDAYLILAFKGHRMYIIKSFDHERDDMPCKPDRVYGYYRLGDTDLFEIRELKLKG